jgi:hypothetical protein
MHKFIIVKSTKLLTIKIAQCYLLVTQIAVVIPNLGEAPKDPNQFREVSFILATQLHYFHCKDEHSTCF